MALDAVTGAPAAAAITYGGPRDAVIARPRSRQKRRRLGVLLGLILDAPPRALPSGRLPDACCAGATVPWPPVP